MAPKGTQKTKITTIKLSRETKSRLDKLKSYKRESYDEILEKILEALTILKSSPERARSRLLSIDNQHKKLTSKKRRILKPRPKIVPKPNSNQDPRTNSNQDQIRQRLPSQRPLTPEQRQIIQNRQNERQRQ